MKSWNQSGCKGVYPSGARFIAICRGQHLGTYDTLGEAAAAYQQYNEDGILPSKASAESKNADGYYVSHKSNTGFKGVCLLKNGTFQTKIWTKTVGVFNTAEEAAAAYKVYYECGKEKMEEAKAVVGKMKAKEREVKAADKAVLKEAKAKVKAEKATEEAEKAIAKLALD